MPAAWLFDNFNGNNFGANFFEGADRELGNAFEPPTDARAVALRWWRPQVASAQKPTILRVWDTTTSTVVATAPSVPDTNVVGWQAIALTTPVALVANRRYIVSHAWQTNRQHPTYGIGTVRPAPFPGAFGAPIGYQSASGAIGLPATGNTGQCYGIDVQLRSQNRPLQWTSVGSIAFDTEIVWNTPANRYVLTLTTIPQWSARQTVAGVDATRVVGFWQPILAGSYGQNGRIDNAVSQFSLPGWQLMDGILIRTYPGTVGTLEGFLVDDVG